MTVSQRSAAHVRQRGPGAAILSFRDFTCNAAIGPAPLTHHKREGDRATPLGRLPIRRILYRADRIPRPVASPALPVEPLAPNDGWCDDPSHADYNRQVSLPHPARCESLWRDDSSYDIVAVLGWNDAPVVRGNGSAIFLHLPTRSGVTEGCVAIAEADLRALFAAGIIELVIED